MRVLPAWPPQVLRIVLADGLALAMAHAAAYLLRFDGALEPPYVRGMLLSLPVIVGCMLPSLGLVGVYRIQVRSLGLDELLLLGRGIVLGLLAAVLGLFLLRVPAVPRGVVLLDAMLALLALGAVRIAPRCLRTLRRRGSGSRVLVLGAGNAGEMIVREMRRHPDLGYAPVGFVDDDPCKLHRQIHGLRVLGACEDVPRLVRRHRVAEVVIAVPAATGAQMRRMVEACQQAGVRYRTVPGLREILDDRVRVGGVREVRIDDLLGRTAVQIDAAEVRGFLAGKRVLITGAAGSIGSELCRQVLAHGPERLVAVDRNENGLFRLECELQPGAGGGALQIQPCDVTDAAHLAHVLARTSPHVVFHAAAYKHVPMMERHPVEAVHNNVFGTANAAAAAERSGVESFVFISTDKAVAPSSVMGATKRLAGFVVQDRARTSRTRFVTVRFGNVLGSDGSVVETFRSQIASGGPVTVTSPHMRRYFMTIPEAVQLTTQAAAMGRGGEVFVLDMGTPVSIDDLARQMIRLSGLEPDRDVLVRYVGLRPGEKLEEILWTLEERPLPTSHPRILRAQAGPPDRQLLSAGLERLRFAVANRDRALVLICLRELVPDYVPIVQGTDGSREVA